MSQIFMTADEYVRSVISAHAPRYNDGALNKTWQDLHGVASEWAGGQLSEIILSGSIAKGTNITGSSDLDMFISLKPDTTDTLAQLHTKLLQFLTSKGLVARRQNVSIGLTYNGYSVDLTPGKKQSNSNYHSIYSNKSGSWTQTNIAKHINDIKNSGRLEEIKLTKIWRKRHGLDFPSFYLEMTVINSLYQQRSGNPANNFMTVLQYLDARFPYASVVDPANSANIVSADLSASQKAAISAAAHSSRVLPKWERIVW